MWVAQYRAASLKRARKDDEEPRPPPQASSSPVGLASLPHELLTNIQECVGRPTDSTEGRLRFVNRYMSDVRDTEQTECTQRHESIPITVWEEHTDLSGCLKTPDVLDTLIQNTPSSTLAQVKTLRVICRGKNIAACSRADVDTRHSSRITCRCGVARYTAVTTTSRTI